MSLNHYFEEKLKILFFDLLLFQNPQTIRLKEFLYLGSYFG